MHTLIKYPCIKIKDTEREREEGARRNKEEEEKGGRRKRAVPVTLNNFVKIRMFSDQTLSKKIIIFGNMTCSC